MHPAAYAYVAGALSALPTPPRTVLEVGARNINGTVRGLFPMADYVGLDQWGGDGVDVVADAVTWQTERRFDCVVCCEVLEHERRQSQLVAALARLLAPGGLLLLTAAGPKRPPHSQVDGHPLRDGEWYGNVDPGALARWLRDAGVGYYSVTQLFDGDDVYATARA